VTSPVSGIPLRSTPDTIFIVRCKELKRDNMTEDLKEMICDFVDHLMPELTPYESALYFLFFRMSFLQNDSPEVRIDP
jgi:hypothetical protein